MEHDETGSLIPTEARVLDARQDLFHAVPKGQATPDDASPPTTHSRKGRGALNMREEHESNSIST